MAILWFVSLIFVPHMRAANSGPNNTITMVNTATVLRCRCDRNVIWRFLAIRNGEDTPIYPLSNVTPEYKKSLYVNKTDEGQYDLCINETKPTNAGKYLCACRDEPFQAQLIVIGDLSCFIQNRSGSDIVYLNTDESLYMTCRAEYWSDWVPLMSWSSSDNTTFATNNTYFSNQSAETSLIFQFDSMNSENSSVRFMFRIHFSTQDVLTSFDAKNVPDYTWTSPIISLHTRKSDINTVETTLVGVSISNQALGVTAIILVVIVIAFLSLTQIIKNCKGSRKMIDRTAVKSRDELNVSDDNHLNRGLDRNLISLSSPDDQVIVAYAEIRPDVPSKNYSHSNTSLDEPANRIGSPEDSSIAAYAETHICSNFPNNIQTFSLDEPDRRFDMTENKELARSVTSMPIYAQVDKSSTPKEPHQNCLFSSVSTADQSYGLHSSCNSAENFIHPDMRDSSRGADGTEYVRVRTTNPSTEVVLVPKKPAAIYAKMDHTQPIPLPFHS